MVMLAHFEESAELIGDRRESTRRALRLSVGSTGEVRGSAQVTIHDLSLTGVLIETSVRLVPGEAFQIDLPEAGKVETAVVWNSGEYHGCQFKHPISTAALSAAVLRSQPSDTLPLEGTLASRLVTELRNINEQVEEIAHGVERVAGRLGSKNDA